MEISILLDLSFVCLAVHAPGRAVFILDQSGTLRYKQAPGKLKVSFASGCRSHPAGQSFLKPRTS